MEQKQVRIENGEYICDIGITVNDWMSILEDKEVLKDNFKKWLIRYYSEPEHKSTCKAMGEKYGVTSQEPQANITNFAKAIQKKLNRFEVMGINGTPTYWIIPMTGRNLANGLFEWTLRPELVEAMENLKMVKSNIINKESVNNQKIVNNQMNIDNIYVQILEANHNLILNGAPGTGKTFMAKKIAEDMNAETDFVQFHPSYDYTDFVEGLRSVADNNGNIGFERRDGVFKEFCKKALQNLIDNKKMLEVLQVEKEIMFKFLNDAIKNKTKYRIKSNNEYIIQNIDNEFISINIPSNKKSNQIKVNIKDVKYLINGNFDIKTPADITKFSTRKSKRQEDSYIYAIYNEIKKIISKEIVNANSVERVEKKNFVFIIDEINRGEISKIFGELFFSIDPGYRGEKGIVPTQYQNLVEEADEFKKGFYVPENVYIIGTMNDIDRSVECMDFAMRRRFVFKEITAEESAENMGLNDDVKNVMKNLNNVISGIEGLNTSYHIGAAYFKDCKDLEKLWNLRLSSLLKEYLRGIDPDGKKFKALEKSYFGEQNNTNDNNDGQ